MIPLLSHFKQLNAAIEDDDFDRILNQCSQILTVSPNDIDALSIETVVHVLNGDFNTALKRFDQHSSLHETLPLEFVYCLYRTEQCQKALEYFSTVSQLCLSSPNLIECSAFLHAQIYYRLRNFSNALSSLKSVLDTSDVDLLTNIYACGVSNGSDIDIADPLPTLDPMSLSWDFLLNIGIYECLHNRPVSAVSLLTTSLQKLKQLEFHQLW
ncbi:hypothetical protein GEMRC1_001688 [Eukaryota sp. GEM-RC1]